MPMSAPLPPDLSTGTSATAATVDGANDRVPETLITVSMVSAMAVAASIAVVVIKKLRRNKIIADRIQDVPSSYHSERSGVNDLAQDHTKRFTASYIAAQPVESHHVKGADDLDNLVQDR